MHFQDSWLAGWFRVLALHNLTVESNGSTFQCHCGSGAIVSVTDTRDGNESYWHGYIFSATDRYRKTSANIMFHYKLIIGFR